MTPRVPIRLRLTAVFTAAMALALAGVGAGTVLHFRHALDAAIDDTLTDRARDLPLLDGTGRLADDADTVVQMLTPDGGLRAHSAGAGTTPLITPTQLAAARTRPTQTERDQVAGLPGRARLLATPGPDGTVVVVAASLAGRDNAIADLQTELWSAFPLVLLIAAAAAYLLATAALRPVEAMRARAAASTAPVVLAPLLHEAAHRRQPAANGRPIAVRCPDDLVAHLDPTQLRRVVDNLIDNALRHGAGPIDITARADRGQVVLSVCDHGPGFPTDFLPRAFDRFTRADTARTGPGTGLGLAIVAAITRRHGGTAHAANHPHAGAEVFLQLPTGSAGTRPPPDP